jgi:hypothetical protein
MPDRDEDTVTMRVARLNAALEKVRRSVEYEIRASERLKQEIEEDRRSYERRSHEERGSPRDEER